MGNLDTMLLRKFYNAKRFEMEITTPIFYQHGHMTKSDIVAKQRKIMESCHRANT